MNRDIGLYIHIPFCVRKCNYCDFLSFSGIDDGVKQQYVNQLIKELHSYREYAPEEEIGSIFFGGGTPSILPEEYILRILEEIRKVWQVQPEAEITIEANPGTLNKNKLKLYRQHGINRLSIGMQSTHNERLKRLGRIHTYEETVAAMYMAREAGFHQINLDLMAGLPGQTLKEYLVDLERVIKLEPEHISSYGLIMEEGTPFYTDESVWNSLPDEVEERKMYRYTKQWLKAKGYQRYEISNYAKAGYACKHNLRYWSLQEYLGIGLGAASDYRGRRIKNVAELDQYLAIDYKEPEAFKQGLYQSCQEVTKKERMEEYMFLGLRKMKGISLCEFKERFQTEVDDIYGECISRYIQQGFLTQQGDYLSLTEAGIDISNQIFADFLLEE